MDMLGFVPSGLGVLRWSGNTVDRRQNARRCLPARSRVHILRCQVSGDLSEDLGTEKAVDQSNDEVKAHEPAAPKLSQEEVREKARKARESAERLQIAAEMARMESERAQLEAEKRKLELERTRLMRMKANPEAADSTSFKEKPEDPVREMKEKPLEQTPERKESDSRDTMNLPPPDRGDMDEELGYLIKAMGNLSDVDVKKVSREDVQTLRDQVFSMETFYVTQVETSTFGDRVVFRGNLRTDASKLLAIFEKSMKKHGLDERVRLFLMEDPASVEESKPVFVALPKEAEPREGGWRGIVASVLFFLATSFTTLGYGIGIFGATPEFLKELAAGQVDEVWHTLPVSLGLAAILAGHEIGHRVAGYVRDVRLGLPICIPSLQTGTYGTITPLNSFPKTRSHLFDVAAAGPATGFAMAIGAFITGLFLTGYGDTSAWYPQIPSSLLQSSLFFALVSKAILPTSLLNQATIAVHPLTIVGCSGLLVNAINMIPFGRLDGGRVVQALYGRIIAGRVAGVTLLIQTLAAVIGNSPLLLFWGLVAVFFQSRADIPCQDEVTEPNNTRSAIGLAGLALMVLILAPYPDVAQVTQALNSNGQIL